MEEDVAAHRGERRAEAHCVRLRRHLVATWRPAELNTDGTPKHPDHFEPFFGSSVWDAPVRLVLVTGITLVVAWASFRWFEKPFLKLKKYFEPR